MNDYGELLKLPYKESDILDPLKKLVKYDKIKPYTLERFDEETNTFNLVGRKRLIKVRLSIRVKEFEKGYTEIEVIAKTKTTENGICKREVRNIVDIIFRELESCEKTKDNDDFSVEILKIKNNAKFVKTILYLILMSYLFYRILFSLVAKDYYTYMVDDLWHYPRLQLIWAIITTGFIMFISKITYKGRVKKRIAKIKSQLFKLIENKDVKKNLSEESEDKNIKNEVKNLTNKAKPYIKKGIDFIKKTREKNPKMFWTFTISIGIIVTWIIIGPIFNPIKLEGEYVQDLGPYKGDYTNSFAHEITFSDGKVYGSGQGEFDSANKKYDYVIRGKKIYIIVNGEEVFSELTVKNRNAIIYGDGVIDEYCPSSPDKSISFVCGPNSDGIYYKQ